MWPGSARRWWWLVLALALGCGGGAGGAAPAAIQVPLHRVGETVELAYARVTMESLTLEGNLLTGQVTVENSGPEPLEVTIRNFEALDARGSPGGRIGFLGGKEIRGIIPPGKKSSGQIQFQFSGTPRDVKVYFRRDEASPLEVGFSVP